MNDNLKPISDAELVDMMQRNQKVLREQIATLEAELAKLRAGQEPVAAQVRFRRPEKGLADWSVWQQTTIKPNMLAWSIDSAGYEVEYRLLYATSQPATVPSVNQQLLEENAKLRAELERRVPDIAGWLWHWLMDYCKKNCQPPATRNDLFAVVSDLRKMLAAAPSAPKADDPVKVQAERWQAVCGDWKDTTLSIHGERTGYIACGIPEKSALALIDAHNAALPAAIAAARKGEV